MDFFTANQMLNEAEVLDVATMELLVRVEATGEDFYLLMADRIGNDEAAELLRRNGREEMGHARRIQRAIAIKTGTELDPDQVVERFEVNGLPDTIDPALFPAIAEGEMKGDAGYQKWADAEPDPEVQRLLRLNGREETKHAERLQQVIEILGVG
jgi:rubrerythrin